MNRLVLVGAMLLPIGVMGVTRVASLEGRIDDFEKFRQNAPQQTVRIQADLEVVRKELAKLERRMSGPSVSKADVAIVRRELKDLEGTLDRAMADLTAQGSSVADLEQWRMTTGHDIEAQIESYAEDNDTRWRGLDGDPDIQVCDLPGSLRPAQVPPNQGRVIDPPLRRC